MSKGFEVNQIKIINQLGQNDFGESKVQEASEKQKFLEEIDNIKWHFIGRIQSNKIRKIVKNFEYIHSLDSYEKLLRISNISLEEKKKPKIMIQVKFSSDPNKGGFNPNILTEIWPNIRQLTNIEIKGLMTINPKGLTEKENFILYEKCRKLADSLQLADCSMGMSGDWQQAIDAGSTWVRLGSIIFGNRLN